jgi:hypothetical protein
VQAFAVGIGVTAVLVPVIQAFAVPVGYSMGMGYDFRVSHAFAITAFAHAMAVGRATPRYNGFVAREIPVNANAMQIGAVLTWQRGRHRRYIPSGER